MRFSVECAFPHLRKRGATSRKGALCAPARMQSAPFGEARTQNALFRDVARPECAFPWRRRHRMHFSVRVRSQNALFRRVRFSSPAQTWSHLTQRRILGRRSHVKAQSAPATSRKGALCAPARMQSAPFGEAHTQNALFRDVEVASPAQNAPFRDVARPECAFP